MSVKDLYRRIASLPPEKRAMLAKQLARQKQSNSAQDTAEQGIAEPSVAAMPAPAPQDDSTTLAEDRRQAPLSLMQLRLWLADRLDPGSLGYSLPILAFTLDGQLVTRQLHRTIIEIERRHESLRTRFAEIDGEPMQLIGEPTRTPMPVIDLSALPRQVAHEHARSLATREGRRSFDLERDALWRCTLFRERPDAHLLIILKHHIISDGWSLGVLYDEMAAIYGAFCKGEASPLPEPSLQYQDFATWQRDWLNDERLAEELDFWHQQLDGAPMILPLPTDRPRPAVKTTHGKRIIHRTQPGLEEAALQLQTEANASLFMVVLAAYQVLLYRLTGQRDLLVGSPAAGRFMQGSEKMIGFFVNTIILRARMHPDMSFRELLTQVRERVFEVYEHQGLPFDRLVEALAPKRDLAYSPVFQAVFSLQNIEMPPLELVDLTVNSEWVQNYVTQSDLVLFADVSADRRSLSAPQVEYNTDLFDDSTIERWLTYWEQLVTEFAANPDLPLAAPALFTGGERQQLLVEWPTSPVPHPAPDAAVRVAEQARTCEHRIAVVKGSAHLSYGELCQRAVEIGRRLQGLRGGAPLTERVLAISLSAGPEQLIGQLGALWAGAGFLTLDPTLPAKRLAWMLEESVPLALLTTDTAAAEMRVECPVWRRSELRAKVSLPRLSLPVPQTSAARPLEPIHPAQLAYVVYTSGSTGRPKGSAGSRGDFSERLHNLPRTSRPGARMSHQMGPGFDASVLNGWAALYHGLTLDLPSEDVRRDPQALAHWVETHAIEDLHPPTPLGEALLRRVAIESPDSGHHRPSLPVLRRIVVGGDRLHRDTVELLRQLPHVELVNDYGPSETTIIATSRTLPAPNAGLDKEAGGATLEHPDVGYALPGVSTYLLDRQGTAVVRGTVGELALGGSGLSRGYLGRPALSAERFRPDPYGTSSRDEGLRLFHTGDLARHRPDGRLEILGRTDFQLKVRGFRVELEEIETVLAGHPAIAEAAVVARREEGSDARLAAFYVARDEIAVIELRHYLGEHLPDYMLPSAFLPLDALPLTANGKLDRKALEALAAPRLQADALDASRTFQAPRSAEEATLARLFVELLGVPRVSVGDDFFELGGHSLLVTRLLARIERDFGRRLPMRSVFEAPSVEALARRLGSLDEQDAEARRPPLQPRPAAFAERAPVSFAQQRLWFLDRLQPGNTVYHLPGAWRLHGRLDVARLEAALDAVVARHESLRTRFTADRGRQPEQVILPAAPLARLRLDLGRLHPADRDRESAHLAPAFAAVPFDLTQAPLVRAATLRLADDDHALLVSQHHIVTDGWSVGLLLDDLAKAYRHTSLSPLPIQYADYAVWQRQWLDGDELDRQLAWWRERLTILDSGTAPVLELPTDRPRPPRQGFRGGVCEVVLPAALGRRVHEFSQRRGLTPFMTLLAGFAALLGRAAGEDDLILGSPQAGRTHAELEPVIGFFVNTLALRCRPRAGSNFDRLADEVRNMVLGAFAHQDVPFEKLVEKLAPERDLSRNPLFQVSFALQDLPSAAGLGTAFGDDVRLASLPAALASTHFDLELHLTSSGGSSSSEVGSGEIGNESGGFSGALAYDADLFDATTVARLAGRFAHLLQHLLDAPDVELARQPWLPAGERHQLLHEWSWTPAPPFEARPLHEIVAWYAATTPDAVAVHFGVQHLSYAALSSAGHRLAAALHRAAEDRGQRLGQDIAIGLCLERAADTIAALLGILQTGAAYVPLDPDYPPERLRHMLADAAPPLVLGRRDLLAKLPLGPRQGLVLEEALAAEPPAAPAPSLLATGLAATGLAATGLAATAPDALAYILYTSGSTGKPKSVGVSHRAVCRLVLGATGALVLRRPGSAEESPERVAQTSSLSFDAATWELWGALLSGGTLVGIDTYTLLEGPAMAGVLRDRGITTLSLVTSVLNQLQNRAPGALAGLRRVHFGAETVDPYWIREVLRHGPPRRLLHMYGPTESTTFTTCEEVREVPSSARTVAIGRPLGHTRVHVLDAAWQPLPAGSAGELATGGPGLARGYLGHPAQTADKFIPDAYGPVGGGSRHLATGAGRLYRTGDLVQHLADGRLEFLGRIDSQVKVRGVRVEIAEVEAVLHGHPDIAEVAVVTHQVRGDVRLTAFLAAQIADDEQQTELDLAQLRRYLQQHLPDAMVPAFFVALDTLPLTPNGKLDHKALEARAAEQGGDDDGEIVAPGTDLERHLLELWRDVLSLPDEREVGVEDDFFDLGGHSLLATWLVARVDEHLGVELPVRSVFEHSTVASQAVVVERALREAAERPPEAHAGRKAPVALPRPLPEPVPLSFAQQRMWLLQQLDPHSPAYSVPMPGRLRGQLEPRRLHAALRALVRRHEILRTTFPAGKSGQEGMGTAEPPRQCIAQVPPDHVSAAPSLPAIDLSNLSSDARGTTLRRLIEIDASRPFDLQQGPLLRCHLLRLAPDDHVLLLNQHHILTDAWSDGVLSRELGQLYTDPSTLPQPSLQYADFAIWQRQYLTGDVLANHLGWWRSMLTSSGATAPPLELPLDRPRPAVPGYEGGHVALPVSAALRRRLEQLGGRDVTLFMVLLAAFQVLLGRHAGVTDVTVGTPVANRTRAGLDSMLGVFINTLALRSHWTPTSAPSFRQLLAQVAEVAHGAYEHQELPFERLVEALQPERRTVRNPLFQVLLALQTTTEGPAFVDLGDVRLEDIPLGSSTVRADLELLLWPVPDDLAPQNPEPQDLGPQENRRHFEAGGLRGVLFYDRDLFDATTVQRLARHFQRLLAAVAADPDQAIDAIPLLDSAEQHQLLREWGTLAPLREQAQSREAEIGETPLHVIVHQLAQRHPDVTAATYGRHHLSYATLDHSARRLGAHLSAVSGTSVEDVQDKPIGVLLERSVGFLISLLGVLHAGGAYLPLDPEHPPERLQRLVADSGMSLLLGRRRHLQWMNEDTRVTAVVAEEVPILSAPLPAFPAEAHCDPQRLAYVLYTSGSTGFPKSVGIPHRAVTALILGAEGDLRFHAGERCGQHASASFDAATWEIWGPLLTGGTIVGIQTDVLLDPPRLARTLRRQALHTLWIVTGVLQRVLDVQPDAFATLDRIAFGGETADPVRVRRLLGSSSAPRRLVHVYGPTENTTYTTCRRLDTVAPDATSVIIGRPLGRTTVYIVDRRLRPMPPGVAGELCTGGDGLARGYLGRPGRTARSFIPDPFATHEEAGSRLYRTGDLVRFTPRGDVDFLGRIDSQVKIRGVRIEPGEIEVRLAALPGVAHAVVTVHPDPSGGQRLAAYIVWHAEVDEPSINDLRRGLAAQLPQALIPAALVTLDAEDLPRTSGGKVDRRTLTARGWPHQGSGSSSDGRRPRGHLELAVAEIWSELLGTPVTSAEADFFQLGGHSLLATQVASRLRAAFHVDLPLRRLFDAPTVAELAALLGQALEADPDHSGEPDLVPIAAGTPPVLSYGQQRLFFLEQLGAGGAAYNLPAALGLAGHLNVRKLASALAGIVERHHVLRTAYVQQRPEEPALPRITAVPAAVLPLVDLSALVDGDANREMERLATEDAMRPFDLASPWQDAAHAGILATPVLRTVLVRRSLAPAPVTHETAVSPRSHDIHALLLNIHHIAADGWSLNLLFQELAARYRGDLPEPLPLQYSDFAAWQRRWLEGDRMRAQVAWWKAQLQGAPPALDLPLDRPRRTPATSAKNDQTVHGEQVRRCLPAELLRRLHQRARAGESTLFMVLLAAFQLLLGRLSGQRDVLIGSPIAGRTRHEAEELIGFFINSLVLRGDLRPEGGRLTFPTLLRRTREQVLGAYAHQDLPFEKLVEELNPERSLDRTPLFQVFFNLINLGHRPIQLPGLELELVDNGELTSKFDFTLYLTESAAGLDLLLMYNADLFDRARMHELLGQYETVLQAAAVPLEATAPGAHEPDLWTLSLRTPESQRALPGFDGDPWASSPPEVPSLPVRLAEAATRWPERPAIRFSDAAGTLSTWSYAELLTRAEQIAAHLRHQQHLDEGDIVAVIAHRRPELVAALWGAWRAGAAFVVIDAAYPPARRQELIERSRASAVLDLDALPPAAPAPQHAGPSPNHTISPAILDSLAATLTFTSGSTGMPKAVVSGHQALARSFDAYLQASQTLGADSTSTANIHARVAGLSGLGHDPLLRDLFVPLLTGGSLCLPADEIRHEPSRLLAWLAEEDVTTVHWTPSLCRLLTLLAGPSGEGNGDEPARLPALRLAVFGGETLTYGDVAALHRLAPRATAINAYGATETPQIQAWHTVTSTADTSAQQVVSLGHGLGETRLLLTQQASGAAHESLTSRLTGVGEPGEVIIAGPCLAYGYLDDPALTAQRFVPLDGGSGAPLRGYRTGDLGRYRVDGSVEFLGRADQQISVRGYRVEPAEIEATLNSHPSVREAAVVATPTVAAEGGPGGELRLVAYAALRPTKPQRQDSRPEWARGPEGRARAATAPSATDPKTADDSAADASLPDQAALKAYLAERLPDYMVPSTLVLLEALPRLASGKLDRGRLPEADATAERSGECVAPRDDLERTLATIWQNLLAVETVGIHDDFFDLGGHSLLAGRVLAAVRDELGTELPLRTLFEAPTVAALAVRVARERASEVEAEDLEAMLEELEGLSDADVEELL